MNSAVKKIYWSVLLLGAGASLACSAVVPPPSPTTTAPRVSQATRSGTGAPPPRTATAPSAALPTTPVPTNPPDSETADTISSGVIRVTGSVVPTRPLNFETIRITVTEISDQVAAETVVERLEVPWALDFAPDGRIFVTERPGRIRIVQDGVLREEPFAVLAQVVSVSEAGLMGLALHPNFAENHHIFVCYSYHTPRGQINNRVARLTDDNGVGTDHRIILDRIPGARNHDGCALGFGPDQKLYVTTGDAQDADLAQDLDSLAGKVLRLEADGSVPDDNPFPESYVYTYGHRNPQGIDWHPLTGKLFIAEHGPDRDDEVNILTPGNNYGWPVVTGRASSDVFTPSVLSFTPTIAISGAAFYSGDKLQPSWEGNLVFAALKASQLHRVVFAPPEFQTVDSSQVLFNREFGRLRAVAVSPDGFLYFTTSNRDRRGDPRPGDDKLMRLVPAPVGQPTVHHPDRAGNFVLELGPGTYRVSWEADGFSPQERRLVLTADERIDLGKIVLAP